MSCAPPLFFHLPHVHFRRTLPLCPHSATGLARSRSQLCNGVSVLWGYLRLPLLMERQNGVATGSGEADWSDEASGRLTLGLSSKIQPKPVRRYVLRKSFGDRRVGFRAAEGCCGAEHAFSCASWLVRESTPREQVRDTAVIECYNEDLLIAGSWLDVRRRLFVSLVEDRHSFELAVACSAWHT